MLKEHDDIPLGNLKLEPRNLNKRKITFPPFLKQNPKLDENE
jgi:hypothetical protein